MGIIVPDANVIAALLIHLPFSDEVELLFRRWRQQRSQFCAPALCPAEVMTTLRKMIVAGQISHQDAESATRAWEKLPIQIVVPDQELLLASLAWAQKTGQMAAYDAQYLALAESLGAEMWTADKRLYNALKDTVAWLHWVGK